MNLGFFLGSSGSCSGSLLHAARLGLFEDGHAFEEIRSDFVHSKNFTVLKGSLLQFNINALRIGFDNVSQSSAQTRQTTKTNSANKAKMKED
jgi:hypothetical protein